MLSPRVLEESQGVGCCRAVPGPVRPSLAKAYATHEKTGEPVLGLYVSAGVALVAVALGDLNVVAEWLTVFFLTTYGALNAVACLETLIGDPSFRPEIKIPW